MTLPPYPSQSKQFGLATSKNETKRSGYNIIPKHLPQTQKADIIAVR